MDAETLRVVLVPIISVLASGTVAVLSVLLTGRANDRIARANREAQAAQAEQERATRLALARAEARRGRREREVQPTLDLLAARYLRCFRISSAIREHDTANWDALVEMDGTTTHLPPQSAWLAAEGYLPEHPILTFLQAELRFLQMAHLAALDQAPHSDVLAAISPVRDAVVAVYQAAERRLDAAWDPT